MIKSGKMVFVVLLSASVLSACGGGGGGSTPAAPAAATTFAMKAGYTAKIVAGSNYNYTVSGSCSGTANSTDSAPVAASFEGVAGFAANTSFTLTVANCTKASNTVTGQVFYDSNYTPLGSSVPGASYGKFEPAATPLPALLKVGDSNVFGTQMMYSDSTKTVANGKRVYSYVVEADTATTALVTFLVLGYDAATPPQLLVTEQSKYRMATDGTLTQLSLDFKYANGVDLLFTKI